MTDILILIGGIAVGYIIILGYVLHKAPTMKDVEDLEEEEKE